MRKLLFLSVLFLLCVTSEASTPPLKEPVPNAKEILLPVGSTGKWISVMELSTIRMKDFETVSQRKLSFFDRLGFKLAQKKLRKAIKNDGTLSNKALSKCAGTIADGNSGSHVAGFALGYFFLFLGVLIAYLINDEKKKGRVKWAWIGLATASVILLIFILAGGFKFFSGGWIFG